MACISSKKRPSRFTASIKKLKKRFSSSKHGNSSSHSMSSDTGQGAKTVDIPKLVQMPNPKNPPQRRTSMKMNYAGRNLIAEAEMLAKQKLEQKRYARSSTESEIITSERIGTTTKLNMKNTSSKTLDLAELPDKENNKPNGLLNSSSLLSRDLIQQSTMTQEGTYQGTQTQTSRSIYERKTTSYTEKKTWPDQSQSTMLGIGDQSSSSYDFTIVSTKRPFETKSSSENFSSISNGGKIMHRRLSSEYETYDDESSSAKSAHIRTNTTYGNSNDSSSIRLFEAAPVSKSKSKSKSDTHRTRRKGGESSPQIPWRFNSLKSIEEKDNPATPNIMLSGMSKMRSVAAWKRSFNSNDEEEWLKRVRDTHLFTRLDDLRSQPSLPLIQAQTSRISNISVEDIQVEFYQDAYYIDLDTMSLTVEERLTHYYGESASSGINYASLWKERYAQLEVARLEEERHGPQRDRIQLDDLKCKTIVPQLSQVGRKRSYWYMIDDKFWES